MNIFKHSICIVFLAISSVASSGLVTAQTPISQNGKFVAVNGAKIYYEEFGKGDPLILLHGFGRTLEDWKPCIPEFAKNFRVIAWDMRGHGRSTNPDTSKVFLHVAASNDLLAFIEKLGLNRVKAIGHSSGAILLLTAATLKPDYFEAIIPVSAQRYFSAPVREFIKTNARPEDYYRFNELEQQHGEFKGRIIARQFYHFKDLQGDPSITPDKLKGITSRALVVHGDNDFVPVDQAYEIFKSISNAHLWIVPNGWHIPHLGSAKTEDFIRISLEFLKDDWGNPEG